MRLYYYLLHLAGTGDNPLAMWLWRKLLGIMSLWKHLRRGNFRRAIAWTGWVLWWRKSVC